MQITVSGKQVDVGESLRTHIETRLSEGINKYLERVTHVTVVISRESHMFKTDINVNTGTHSGIVIKSRAESDDVYACFDAAATKVEKQLRRYKRRITNHHARADERLLPQKEAIKAKKYVIEGRSEEEKEEPTPLVIAEKQTEIETLTVSEAVMRMDLADLPALMFFNSSHGRINIVYRRDDGNISWVDPEQHAAA